MSPVGLWAQAPAETGEGRGSQDPGLRGLWEETPGGWAPPHLPGKMGCGSHRHADSWVPSTEEGEGHTRQVTASNGGAEGPVSSLLLLSHLLNDESGAPAWSFPAAQDLLPRVP